MQHDQKHHHARPRPPRAPLASEAQRPGNIARVGMLNAAQPRSTSFIQAFEHHLRDLGYVEGQNLLFEFRTGEGQAERYPALAAELLRLPVDVLVVTGPEATLRAAKDATHTIPIVMVAIDYDPVARGYIAGLPRPGGNITGLFLQQLDLTGKRLELLKDVLPQLTRSCPLGCVLRRPTPKGRGSGSGIGSAAPSPRAAPSAGYDYASAFSAAAAGRAEALLPLMSPVFFR